MLTDDEIDAILDSCPWTAQETFCDPNTFARAVAAYVLRRRPMSEAPRDGEEVMLLTHKDGMVFAVWCQWRNGKGPENWAWIAVFLGESCCYRDDDCLGWQPIPPMPDDKEGAR